MKFRRKQVTVISPLMIIPNSTKYVLLESGHTVYFQIPHLDAQVLCMVNMEKTRCLILSSVDFIGNVST